MTNPHVIQSHTNNRHRFARAVSVLGLAVLGLAACSTSQSTDRQAEQAVAPMASPWSASPSEGSSAVDTPAPLTPDEQEAGVLGGTVGSISRRGVDLCIFNKLPQPITVTFKRRPGTQGDPTVAPGGWYCGFDPYAGYDPKVEGSIEGLSGETATFGAYNQMMASPGVGATAFFPAGQTDRGCHNDTYLTEGQSRVLFDSGQTKYSAGRNADDDNWKYLTLTLEPSQGLDFRCDRGQFGWD